MTSSRQLFVAWCKGYESHAHELLYKMCCLCRGCGSNELFVACAHELLYKSQRGVLPCPHDATLCSKSKVKLMTSCRQLSVACAHQLLYKIVNISCFTKSIACAQIVSHTQLSHQSLYKIVHSSCFTNGKLMTWYMLLPVACVHRL